MELMGLGDMDSGCEEENCGLASGFPEDCSDQACLWEEPMFGLIELVCVTVLYIPLMLFGLLGNILTILVVCLRPHMRSSTYLYLSSMAVSDLLILLLLPLDLYKLWRPRPWPLGDLACKLTMFLSECCTFCTILHITFLSVERYLAVCWPITSKTLVTRRRTRALIGCLWLGAAVSAAPVLVMVGVEEVGAEEPGLVGGWREDGGWTGMEGEQGGFMIGGREIGSGHVTSMDVGLERMKWGEDEKKRWGEGVVEEVERKLRTREPDESKQGVGGGTKDDAGEGAGEGMMEAEGKQQNKMKEDEGGGREKGVDAGSRGEVDTRECRCTHYAVSSGLLSAMMILSNLYFLVPLCILGLVYSLIGRTLWLRPQSSRRDQSHRHTVKMLGVIVLAFVLCWLPFHVGRTIFSLSQSTGADSQEAYSDSNEMNTVSDSTDGGINTNAVNEPINFKTFSETAKMTAHAHPERDDMLCDKCAKNKVEIKIQSALNSHTSFNTDTSTNTLYNVQDYRTPSTVGTNTYTVSPTQLYNDQTNDYTPFNYTYTDPDTNLYFLYYLSQYFNLVSSVLFYLSAAVNPLLYNLMSARYRQAVHSLIHTHSHTQSHRLRSFTIRHSTTTL